MAGPVPDASDPQRNGSLPIAPPLPFTSSAGPPRSGWFVGGVAFAVVGQLLAGAPWLLAAYSFIRYATPDSLFFVDCCTAVLQLGLFAGCVGTGLGILRRNRGLGLGLITGWAGGLAALVIGTILIFRIA